jgi:Spy/CpxP family protein refolding chaperone
MSEHKPNVPADTGSSSPQPGTPKRRRFVTGLVAGGLLGGLMATAIGAWSNNHGGPGGWHGGGRWCRTSMSPEAQRERAEFATDWMLSKVNATDAQRSQIKAIVAAALQDLAPVRDEHRQHREAFLAALTQPSVDRATLEDLRRAELQLAENASQRIVTALAEVADVLTPEQRAELVKMAERFRR